MKKSIPILGVIFIWLCISVINISAENKIESYTLSLESLNDQYLKNMISSMSIIYKENDDSWCLYINNEFVAMTSDNQKMSFDFNLSSGDHLSLIVDQSTLEVHFSYTKSSDVILVSAIVLNNEDNLQYISFYPDASSLDNCIKLKAMSSGNILSFDQFEYNYAYQEQGVIKTKKISYDIKINNEINQVLVNKNGSLAEYNIEPTLEKQTFFLETLVPQHSLSIDYLSKDLDMRTFQAAKFQLYTTEEIDRAVENEKLLLKHEQSGLTYQVPLRQYITLWHRIGAGDYDTSTTEIIQTVCQWQQEVCSNVRERYTDNGRLYAVFGSSYDYVDVEKYTDRELKQIEIKSYKNITWPNDLWVTTSNPVLKEYSIGQMKTNVGFWSDWSSYSEENKVSDCSDQFDCNYKSQVFYKKRTASWSDWNDYSSNYPASCNDSFDCSWESASFYNKRTGTWSAYGSYTNQYPYDCNDNDDCSWKSLKYNRSRTSSYSGTYSGWKASCNITDDYHCTNYYKYTCKLNSNYNTRYSNVYYSVGSQGACASGYKITSRIKGYRYRYLSWSVWSSYTTNNCVVSVGYRKCQSETRYATRYRNWGAWSGYIQSTCNASNDTQCLGPKTYYRSRWKNWGAWSNYSYDNCSENATVQCASAKLFSYQYRNWLGWSEWEPIDLSISKNPELDVYYRVNDGLITWDEIQGNSKILGTGAYWLNESKIINDGFMEVDVDYATNKISILETYPEMTEARINELANKLSTASIKNALLNTLLSTNGKVLWKDIEEISQTDLIEYQNNGIQGRDRFLNSKIFIPYIYVREHYRAVLRDIEIKGYNDTLNISNRIASVIAIEDVGKLVTSFINTDRESKVIYYDYHNPLINYNEIPDNWIEHMVLLDEIKNANLNNYDFKIVLNKDDINNIRSYLLNGGYQKIGSCDILREFSYLIEDNDSQFENWLSGTESGCGNVNGN